MAQRVFLIACLTFPLAALAGCSSDSEDTASAESDVRVKPKGTDAAPSVTFKLPKSLGAADVIDGVTYEIDRNRAVPSEKVTVPVGPAQLAVNAASLQTSDKLNVNSGVDYTVDLAAIKIEGDPNENWFVKDSTISGIRVDSKFAPFLATTPLTLSFGLSDGLESVDARPGEAYVRKLSDLSGRRSVRVHPPVRELPNCGDDNVLVSDDIARTSTSRFNMKDKPVTFGTNLDSHGFRLVQAAGTESSCTWVDLPLSDVGKPPVDFKIGRIDVDDVDIDNGTKTVRGTYSVVSLVDSRQGSSSGCPTGTGVSVVPGKYKVEVTYTVTEGTKTSVYEVDVP